MTEPELPPYPPQQPVPWQGQPLPPPPRFDGRTYNTPPIVIQQTTSPGTKIAVWIIALVVATPIIITALCCLGGPLLAAIGGAAK